MAWSIPTYEGIRADGQPSNFRVALFELCRAVNEREALCDINGTVRSDPGSNLEKFIKADGTEGSNVAFEDFAEIHKDDGLWNLFRVRSRIGQMATRVFTKTSGRSDVWTHAEWQAENPYITGATKLNSRVTDAQWWQGLQDALDKLVYVWRNPVISSGETLVKEGFEKSDSVDARQKAWDNALADTETAESLETDSGSFYSRHPVGWLMEVANFPSHGFRARLFRKSNITYSNEHPGVLQDVWFDALGFPVEAPFVTQSIGEFHLQMYHRVISVNPSVIEYGDPLEIKLVAPNDTIGFSNTQHDTSEYFEKFSQQLTLSDWETATTNISVENELTPPETEPLQVGAPFVDRGFAYYYFNVTQYLDIAGELTDQA